LEENALEPRAEHAVPTAAAARAAAPAAPAATEQQQRAAMVGVAARRRGRRRQRLQHGLARRPPVDPIEAAEEEARLGHAAAMRGGARRAVVDGGLAGGGRARADGRGGCGTVAAGLALRQGARHRRRGAQAADDRTRRFAVTVVRDGPRPSPRYGGGDAAHGGAGGCGGGDRSGGDGGERAGQARRPRRNADHWHAPHRRANPGVVPNVLLSRHARHTAAVHRAAAARLVRGIVVHVVVCALIDLRIQLLVAGEPIAARRSAVFAVENVQVVVVVVAEAAVRAAVTPSSRARDGSHPRRSGSGLRRGRRPPLVVQGERCGALVDRRSLVHVRCANAERLATA